MEELVICIFYYIFLFLCNLSITQTTTMATPDITQKVEINKQKANEEQNAIPQLGALEEDDEFEEFEVDGGCGV